MKISEALLALSILKDQLDQHGLPTLSEYEEISVKQDAIRLRLNGKTLRVPLVQFSPK